MSVDCSAATNGDSEAKDGDSEVKEDKLEGDRSSNRRWWVFDVLVKRRRERVIRKQVHLSVDKPASKAVLNLREILWSIFSPLWLHRPWRSNWGG